MANHTLVVGKTLIPYTVRRSKTAMRRRVHITPDRVELITPESSTSEEDEAFIYKKRRWIFDETEIMKERLAQRNTIARFVTGAKIPYRGRQMRLRIETTDDTIVDVQYRNGFIISVPATTAKASRDALIEDALRLWLRKRLRSDVETFVSQYSKSLDLRPNGLRIKAQKHLWGSCGQDRIINLNWHLIFAPKTILEYAVVHELCHLRYRNHDKSFWSLVGSIMPDYEKRKAWLEQNEHMLGFEKIDPIV
ncbi:MAG: metal-dependent hydrolase [Rhodospirillaceae bacterium]|nr:MAG: metal-dependent hydrolase [Rhodospirillaceae bacterium]